MPNVAIDTAEFSGVTPGVANLKDATLWLYPFRPYGSPQLVTEDKVVVTTVGGVASVFLPQTPTGNGVYVEIRGVRLPAASRKFIVAIPAGDCNLFDLPHLDPDSLDPEADPEDAWWAAVDDMVQSGAVDGSGHLILSQRDGDTIDAGYVIGPGNSDANVAGYVAGSGPTAAAVAAKIAAALAAGDDYTALSAKYVDTLNGFFGASTIGYVPGQSITQTSLTSAVTVGATVLPVASATGIVANMSLLLLGGTALQQVVKVVSVAGSNVTVTPALLNPMANAAKVSPIWINSNHLTSYGYQGLAYQVVNAKNSDGSDVLSLAAGERITFFGNSWIDSKTDWATQTLAKFPTALVTNAGVSGNTSAAMLARFDTDVPTDSKYVAFNEPGGNDLQAGITKPVVVDNMQKLVRKIQAIGAIPVYFGTAPLADPFLAEALTDATLAQDLLRDGHMAAADAIGALLSKTLVQWFPTDKTLTPDATTAIKGLVELATTAEATTGTDTVRAVTPAGLAAVAVTKADATALTAKADLVGGVVPTAQIPAIALTTGQVVANRTALLALSNVQQGDIGVISGTADKGTYILTTSDPTQFANWLLLNAPTDVVSSVNGQTGTVVLGKTDLSLGNVDNTSDVNKPVSTAQTAAFQPIDADLTAIAALTTTSFGRLLLTLADAASARVGLGLGNVDNTSDASKNSAAATLTNKRITARVVTVTSSATVTLDWDATDLLNITAQAAGLTLAFTGTPTDGQPITISIKDNGTARAITYPAAIRSIGQTLPTTTVVGKYTYIGGRWNAADGKLHVLAATTEG